MSPRTRITDENAEDISFLSEAELNEFFSTAVISGTEDATNVLQTFDQYFPGRGLITAAGNATVITGSNFVTISGSKLNSPSNVFYVDNGAEFEGTADGSFYRPFSSIRTAADAAAAFADDISGVVGFYISVNPGIYVELPITLVSGVKLVAHDDDLNGALIIPVTSLAPLITCKGYNSVQGFLLTGSQNTDMIKLTQSDGTISTLRDLAFIGSNKNCIIVDGEELSMDRVYIDTEANASCFLRVLDGTVNARSCGTNSRGVGSVDELVVVSGSDNFVRLFDFRAVSSGVGEALVAKGDHTVEIFQGDWRDAQVGVTASGACKLSLFSTINTATTPMNLLDSEPEIFFSGGELDPTSLNFPAGYDKDIAIYASRILDDEGLFVHGQVSVGRPDRGSELAVGGGDSYTKNVIIYSTDNTASSSSDGGNLIDLSSTLSVLDDNTATFQGTSVNHSILIGVNINDGTDALKHFGFKVNVVTGAVGSVTNNFVIEHWDGSAWVEEQHMSVHADLFYQYANNSFLRSNSSEHVRYNVEVGDHWVKRNINGYNLYWSRIRITSALTTLPTFQILKVHPSRFEANADGTNEYFGRARFKQTLSAAGNIFGESGGVSSASQTVGSGTLPTGWTHQLKNVELNQTGDTIYTQFALPKGIDTSSPLDINVNYSISNPTAGSGTVTFGALPIEVQGIPAVDPSGGIPAIPRTTASTEVFTSKAAYSSVGDIQLSDDTRLFSVGSDSFDISSYYPGDMLLLRFEYTSGGNNRQLVVWSMEINGVRWRHGDRI